MASARKLDFSQVVTQAQAEFAKLTTTERADAERSLNDTAGPSSDETAESPTTPTNTTSPESTSTTTAMQSLFSRLQSAIPPNVVAAVQHNLPEALKSETGALDIASLRETFSKEFMRVQGVTRAQAEEYIKKSEGFLKEAQVVLKDAVKVIPPEEQATQPGFTWDGTDMWMLPTESATSTSNDVGKGKGKEKASESVATRAEALLKRLRTDPEIIGHELEGDLSGDESWVGSQGNVESDAWKSRIEKELNDGPGGQALSATKDVLGKYHLHSHWA